MRHIMTDDFGKIYVCSISIAIAQQASRFYFLYVFGGKYFHDEEFPSVDEHNKLLVAADYMDVASIFERSKSEIRDVFEFTEECFYDYNINHLLVFISGSDEGEHYSEALDILNMIIDFASSAGIADDNPHLEFIKEITISLFETDQLLEYYPRTNKTREDIGGSLIAILLMILPKVQFV